MEILILGGVLILGAMLALDLALAMIMASVVVLGVLAFVPMHLIAEKAVSQVSLYPLMAIPGFIIAGELMNAIGMTRALGELARQLVGRWRGGMGMATLLACMLFGGMTGSGLAETVAIGSLMIPMLAAHGYPRAFSAAMIAAGGSLGPIIPPSIPMVIYASIAPGVSIAALFAGGILPGILLGAGFMLVVVWRVKRLGIVETSGRESDEASLGRTALDAIPALVVPGIIFYSIFSGAVTITEASALAAGYVAVYGLLRGKLTPKALMDSGRSTLVAIGIFGFIIAAAGPFSFLMSLQQAPQLIGQALMELSGGNAHLLMLTVTGALLLLGLLVEATSLVIILAPILAGTAKIAGIDPLHMALVSITALMIGVFTPPVGTNLFAIVGISKEPIEKVAREVLPFAAIAFAIVLLLALMPWLTTWLPGLLVAS